MKILRQEVLTARWVARDWMRMSATYRSARKGSRDSMDGCFVCGSLFADGDPMSLCCFEKHGNRVLCALCADELEKGDDPMSWDDDFDYDEEEDEYGRSRTLRTKFSLPRADAGPPPHAVEIPSEVLEGWARFYVEQWMGNNLGAMVEKATMTILAQHLVDWIHKTVESTIEEQLEQFFTGQRELTDGHGFKKGSREALGAAIIAYTKQHLSASTDRYGDKRKRLETLADELLIKPLGDDLKKMLRQVREEQKAKAEAFVAKMMAASLKQITP